MNEEESFSASTVVADIYVKFALRISACVSVWILYQICISHLSRLCRLLARQSYILCSVRALCPRVWGCLYLGPSQWDKFKNSSLNLDATAAY